VCFSFISGSNAEQRGRENVAWKPTCVPTGAEPNDESYPMPAAGRIGLRDRLKGPLAWTRETGRL
jgi:hypothetical protein